MWAVEDTAVQVAWGSLPAGPVEVSASFDSPAANRPSTSQEHSGGPGALILSGLPSSTEMTVRVAWFGGETTVETRTLETPPGELLSKIATISDLHLGSDHFGFFKQMRPSPAEPFAFESAHSAISESLDWGAEHLVVKGDAAHHGREEDFAEFGRLVDAFPSLPISAIPGNHDVDFKGGAPLPQSVGNRGLSYERHVSRVDLEGVQIILGNTTVEMQGPGSLKPIRSDLLDLCSSADRPVMIVIHQQLQQTDPVRYWPPGISGTESRPFLDDLGRATERALVTSGHTHRNRARMHRTTLITEVASTHHWPGVWAGYAIHEGGIRQVVRRISSPPVIAWHEYSKNAVMTVWQRYAAGSVGQRCISHNWQH